MLKNLDGARVSIKAVSDGLHRDFTGASNCSVLENFVGAYKMGISLEASSVFIPGYIDCDEIEKIAGFVASVDPGIPYHITGYVPVPDNEVLWRQPSYEEVENAMETARSYLSRVTFSCITKEQFFNLRRDDVRYRSVRVV